MIMEVNAPADMLICSAATNPQVAETPFRRAQKSGEGKTLAGLAGSGFSPAAGRRRRPV